MSEEWWRGKTHPGLRLAGGHVGRDGGRAGGDHQRPQSRGQADRRGQEQTSTIFSDGARREGQLSLQLHLHLGCQKYLSQIGCL